MLLAQKRPSLVNRRHVTHRGLSLFGATGPVTARVFRMWRKFVQRYTRRFNARLQGRRHCALRSALRMIIISGFLPLRRIHARSEDCVRSSRSNHYRTAGSGTKGQTIGTLFNQQV